MSPGQADPTAFHFVGNRVGVLLIHGYTGSPSEMRPMGEFLHKQGYTVKGILLKGHGETAEAMTLSNWRDWWESVVQGYEELAPLCDRVIVAGLSMGGCLTLLLAGTFGLLEQSIKAQKRLSGELTLLNHRIPSEQRLKLSGIIPMCAPVWVQDRRARIVPIISYFMPYLPREGQQPDHIHPYIHYFDKTPLRTLSSLLRIIRNMRRRLVNIEVPTLILQAKLDQTVQPRSATYIQNQVTSSVCRLKWYENSDHILVLDHDHLQVFQDIDEFIQEII